MGKMILAGLVSLLIVSTSNAQLMDWKKQEHLKWGLPQIEGEMNQVLQGKTPGKYLWYTEVEMPFAHQDHGNVGENYFFWSPHNYSALATTLGGNEPTGNNYEFPWKHPGGTDNASVYTWKIMYLPSNTKIKIYRPIMKNIFSNVGNVKGWDWEFPNGTVFFEVLSFKDRLRVFEIRERHKNERGNWVMNLYRPFATHEHYISALSKINETLAKNHEVIMGYHNIRFNDFNLHKTKMAFDVTLDQYFVKGIGENNVKSLYNQLGKFVSTKGEIYAGRLGFGPSSIEDGAYVPKGYNGSIVGNSNQSCMKCHDSAGDHVQKFASRDWYGHVRGSMKEKILSFHPIDPRSLSHNRDNIQVRINPALKDFVE